MLDGLCVSALALNKPALIFLCGLMVVVLAGLHAGRQRCSRCGKSGPMVGYGRMGQPVCWRCDDEEYPS